MNKPPDRLGKGLSSLLPARTRPVEPPLAPTATPGPITELPISKVKPNPHQPRRNFVDQPLQELAQSIRVNGIIQPLSVRKRGDEYQIIAGERRWRAAQIAGLTVVPVAIQEISDEKLLEIALVENIQREDLNPIELAEAFERLTMELNLSHEEIGRRTGKDRATISNTIRLLQLQPEVQQIVASGKMSAGHARALIGIRDADRQKNIAYSAIAENWTVRQIEKTVKSIVSGVENPPVKPPAPAVDPNVRAAIDEMQQSLGTKVRIVEKSKGKGVIEIEYYSPDDLDRLYTLITSS